MHFARFSIPGELSLAELTVASSGRKSSAEERLALAVVTQAVNDIALYHSARYPWTRRVYREAWRWMFSDDRMNPYSYINLCESLGLSPGRIRAGVNAIIKRHESDAGRKAA